MKTAIGKGTSFEYGLFFTARKVLEELTFCNRLLFLLAVMIMLG